MSVNYWWELIFINSRIYQVMNMKKLILLLLLGIMSLKAFSEGLELRVGADGLTYIDEVSEDATGGYVLKAEYFFGVGLEFGLGFAYRQLGVVEDADESSIKGSYMGSSAYYAVARLNFGEDESNAYMKVSAGYATNQAADFQTETADYLEEQIIATYGGTTALVEYTIDSGLYYGVGVGYKFRNILVELSYDVIAYQFEEEATLDDSTIDLGLDYEAETVSLISIEVGYIFGETSYY